MKPNRFKTYTVTNHVTGETFQQSRAVPRHYCTTLSFEPGDNPVQQQFKHECDINYIVKNYQLPQTQLRPEQFGDFSDAPSFQESMNLVIKAQQQFLLLPASTRARFENEPAKFLEFVHNPENASELVKMGLARKADPIPTPDPVRVIIDNVDPVEPTPPKSKPTK